MVNKCGRLWTVKYCERDAAAAEKQNLFARLPEQAQLYESVQRFRELTDCFQPRQVCATCGAFSDTEHCERFSLNPLKPILATRELPAQILERMRRVCVGKNRVWMQSANHPERPGLARLEGILLQWRYWADDYSKLCPGGVDEDTETILLCNDCYKHLNARRCRKPPKFALANGFQFGQLPEALRVLTAAEWHVVRPFRVVANILELHMEDPVMLRTHATQLKLRGHIVAFPQNVLGLVKTWPATPDDVADTMHVVLLNPHECLRTKLRWPKCLLATANAFGRRSTVWLNLLSFSRCAYLHFATAGALSALLRDVLAAVAGHDREAICRHQ